MPLLKEDIEEQQENLGVLKANTRELDSEEKIPFGELFPEEFMGKYTNSDDIAEFLESAPVSFESAKSFSSKQFDDHIAKHTVFDDWNEMKRKAAEEWIVERINL